MHVSTNTTYYVTDWMFENGKIYIFNDEWEYIGYKPFALSHSMTQIDNILCLSQWYNVKILDKGLNGIYGTGSTPFHYPGYRGIYHNYTNNLIYVASMVKK